MFEPDIAGYSVGSMMTNPASHSGHSDGTTRFAWTATLPRGSRSSSRRSESSARSATMRSKTVSPGGGDHAADDDVADLAAGVAADDRDDTRGTHLAATLTGGQPPM